ncbi:MAG: tetratricopeptide repeat protein [Planctomycetales bacterium]|nr:tetratricopeptide repeat protein [Planctomycetales bacterium]
MSAFCPARISCRWPAFAIAVALTGMAVAQQPAATAPGAPAAADPYQAGSLVVAKVKLQNKETIYAQPGQAMVVVSSDETNIVVRAVDGESHLRVARTAMVPIQQSAPLYDELIKATPTDANLFLARANVYSARGESDKAVADYRQAIKLDDQYEAAYVSLAEAQMRLADYDGVMQTVASVMKLDPENPTYFVLRGVAYRHQEKLDNAIAEFTEALKRKPDHAPALSSRGFMYYLKRDYTNAVKDFDAWVKVDPQNAMALNNRGYNRQFAGDFVGALQDYDKAIEIAPQFALAFQNKAWLLATCPDDKIRNGNAAFEAASKACVMRSYKVPEDLKALAAAYAELKDFKHAIEFQQRVVDSKEGEGKSVEQNVLDTYKQNQPFRIKVE